LCGEPQSVLKKIMKIIIEERFGPCLSYQDLEEPIFDLYDMAVNMVSQALSQARILEGDAQHPYPCLIGFPEKLSFNAGTCDLDAGGSIVVINAAVPYLLFCACFIYSSRANKRTGLPVEENDKLLVYDTRMELIGKLPKKPRCVSDYSALFDQLCSNEYYRSANMAYTLFMYSIAIRFIVMHEVMHIVLGHTAYIKKVLQLDTFMEFSSARESIVDPGFLQCMEFLADRHAIRGIARKMIEGDPYFSSEAQEQLIQEAIVDQRTYLIRGVMTAATVVFHLFPSRDETLHKPIMSHPHPYLRSQWLAMELGHELGKECDVIQAIFTPLAYTAATLSANFNCPGDWRIATELDRNKKDGDFPYLSDRAYQEVLQQARQWSNHIYTNYGPKFVNSDALLPP
jgi:hypothetical protein